uniref:Uncharacterized protein n=1 Tax=Globodera rostochiensis TaxID=31243 RepID=A0A914HYC6_GLORO
MLLIFPLDLLFALVYPVYNIAVLILRAYKPLLSPADFVSYYHMANTLLVLHSLITVAVYIRFIKFVSKLRRQNIVKNSPNDEAKMHFKQLQAQWN